MRLFLLLLSILCLPVTAKTVTDITGRQVVIPDDPQRIVLGESRMLYTLALLEPDPGRRIAGWPGDLARYDPQIWAQFLQTFPAIAQIPQLGRGALRDINPERILQLNPDLVILPVLAKNSVQDARLLALLEQAHIPVVRVDLRVDLLNKTVPSLRLLGEVFNATTRASHFIEFYQEHMAHVRDHLATWQGPRPRVMLQLHLGRRNECCTTAVNGNLGQLLAFAGGENIASPQVKGVFGQLSPEYVLSANPDIYIATGMASPGDNEQQLQLGPQVNTRQASASLQAALTHQALLSQLPAIRNGRAWGVWHNFYLSPWHVVAVEMFAKALYPTLFHDLDPQQTLNQLYQRFLPLTFTGTFWSHTTHE